MADQAVRDSIEETVKIINRRGLHARAAAKFVRLVETHSCEICVVKDGVEVCGASIMGLLMLGAGIDTHITIRAQGDGAETALADLVDLINRRFDEDQ